MAQVTLQWKLKKSNSERPTTEKEGASGETVTNNVVTTVTTTTTAVSQDISSLPPTPTTITPQTYSGLTPYGISVPSFRILKLITDLIALGRFNPKTKTSAKSPTTGTLYAFTRPSDPGYVKIGFTADTLYNRMHTIKCHCGFEPQLQFIFEDVPFPIRVESLIHFELQARGLRRVEEVCRFGNAETMEKDGKKNRKGQDRRACKGGHSEWFEMRLSGRNGAESVMQKWVKWMKVGHPYDDQGKLRDSWRKAIVGLDKELERSSQGAGELICKKMRAMTRMGEIARIAQAAAATAKTSGQAGAEKKKISNTEMKFREEALEMMKLYRSFKEDAETRGWFTYEPPKQGTENDGEDSSDDEQLDGSAVHDHCCQTQ